MNLFDLLITQPIFNLLLTIYNFVGDFGISIIVFTVIVKFLMWPITKGQLHQTKVMRKIQPELKKIKRNAKGNKQVESLQMMELYKKNNIIKKVDIKVIDHLQDNDIYDFIFLSLFYFIL